MKYAVRRVLHSLVLLAAVSVLSFVFADLAPGDFFSEMRLDPRVAPGTAEALRVRFGLNRPLPVRYAAWLGSMGRGEFGYSLAYNSAVGPLLRQRIPGTLLLTATATCLAWLIAVPLGIWNAANRGSWKDSFSRGALSILLSIPELLLAVILLVLAVETGWLPAGGMHAPGAESWATADRIRDTLRHMVIPVAVLVMGMLPTLVRHVRSAVAEAMDSPFALAARAHGIPRRRRLFRHILPASLNSLVSLFGFSMGTLLSASLLVEVVVGWPGLGPLFLEAIMARDFALVLGVVMTSTALLIAGHLIADLLLYRADPEDSHVMKLRLTLVWLAMLHALVVLAAWVAPYDYAEQHREYPFSPPTRLHFRDAGGGFHLSPFVYGVTVDPATGNYREDRAHTYPVEFFTGGRLFGVAPPGVLFLWGSDGFGRDVLSRFLYGGQISLLTGLAAAFLSLFLGLLWGMLAGFHGGWVDGVLMRGAELFLALPWLYLLLGARAFLPLHISPTQAFFLLVAIIGTVGWVRPARIVRGVVLSARERGFVLAARGFGASPGYLMRRHILPLTWNVVLTQATILIPQYIVAEVTLSFLGLGVGEPVPSWGNMLADARQYHSLIAHTWMLAPGLATVPLLLGYLTLADILLERPRGMAIKLHL